MRDLGVLERAHHVRHGVHAADVGEEPVAQALAAARALGQPGDVDDVDGGVDLLGRLEHLVQPVQPRVGHGHDAEVGLGGGERVGGRRGLRVGERVEQSGLADVGQTDDAELHGCLPSLLVSRVSRRRDMSRSWSLHAPRVLLVDVARRVSRGVCHMAARRRVSAGAALARRPVTALNDGRGDAGRREGTSSDGTATVPAGRPGAAGLVTADAQLVGGGQRVVAQPGGPAEAARHRELVAAGRRVEVDHADGRAPVHRAHACRGSTASRAGPSSSAPKATKTMVYGRRHVLDARRHLEQQPDAGGVVGVALAHGARSRSGRRR